MATIEEILKAAKDQDRTNTQVRSSLKKPVQGSLLKANTAPTIKPIHMAPKQTLQPMDFRNASGQTRISRDQQERNTQTLLKELKGPQGGIASFTKGAALGALDPFYLRSAFSPTGFQDKIVAAANELNKWTGNVVNNPRAVAQGLSPVTTTKVGGTWEDVGQGVGSMVGVDPIGIGIGKIAQKVGGIILKSGKKIETKADFDALGLPERVEVVQEINKYNAKNRKLGVNQDLTYRGNHEAPIDDGFNAPAFDLAKIYPSDIYSKDGARIYGGGEVIDNKAMQILLKIRNNPDAEITIYRAVPKDAPETINRGDWVTITKEYAKKHGEHSLDDDFKIVESKVKAKNLFTNADSIHEFGYDGPMPGKTYKSGTYPLPRMKYSNETQIAKTVAEYKGASDNGILQFREKALNGELVKGASHDFLQAGTREVNEIKQLTGIDVTGFQHSAQPNTFEHIELRHGSNGAHDHSMSDVNDIGRMPYVLKNFDDVELLKDQNGNQVYSTNYYDKNGNPAPIIKYSKRINGTYYLVEAVPDAKSKRLRVVSAYIKKAGQEPNVNVPGLNVRNDLANSAFDNSIPQSAEINNQQIPPTQNYTRDSFNQEMQEGFESRFETGMKETELYGEATHVASEPEIAKSIVGNGVSKGKDIQRNADAAFRNSPEGRAWFKRTFEDNFYQSKGRYATEMKQKLDELYNNVVKDLGIKKGSKESAAVQWIGEGTRQRFDEKGTPISNETIPYTLENLKEDFNYTMPNGKKAWENIVSAEVVMRRTYDSYVDQINGALRKIYPNVEAEVEKIMTKAPKAPIAVGETIKTQTRGNYGKVMAIDGDRVTVYFVNNQTGKSATVDLPRNEIIPQSVLKAVEDATVGKRLQPRKDYFRHFTEQQKGLMVGLDNIINGATAIDPRLVGLSEFTKPNSRWTAFLQRRGKGDMYTEDAVGGLLEYIPQAEYKINIEPNIPVLRKIIKDLKENTVNTRNANQFIDQLIQITNDLAGKTNQWDRMAASFFGEEKGRKALNTLSLISNRMRANAVVGNFNTVLAQFFNLPNVAGYAKNPVDLAGGFKQAIQAHAGSKEAQALLDKSMFLKERYLDRSLRRFDESMLGNTNSFLSWTMEIGDKAIAEGAWLTFHKQALKKNLSEDQAILFADELTRKSVAGRGIGEMPLSQKAKVTKLFVPFQVEVRNAYNVLKDLGDKKDAVGIIGIFATTFLMNELLEKTTGRRIGFDPIDVIRDGAMEAQNGKQTGEVAKGIGFGLAGNALTNMPGGSYIAAAGASALDLNEYQMQELFGQNDPSRFGTGNIALQTLGAPLGQIAKGQNVDLLKPALSIAPRFGGRQIERTIRGMQDMDVLPKEKINLNEGISVSSQDFPASYSQSGRLRFAIDPTMQNYATAATLGTWSTPEGKNYIQNELQPLGEKQTPNVEAIAKLGVDPKLAETMVRGLSSKKTKAEEIAFVNLFNINTATKRKIMQDILGYDPDGMTKDQREKFNTQIRSSGIGAEQYLKTANLVSGIEGDGTYLSASKQKKAMIDRMNQSLKKNQLEALYEAFGVSEKVW